MARMNFVLDDELEREFRNEVVKRLGFKKGNIQKAIEEAIRIWITSAKD